MEDDFSPTMSLPSMPEDNFLPIEDEVGDLGLPDPNPDVGGPSPIEDAGDRVLCSIIEMI
ncbi:hypothetical protein KIN20_028351 [Parelaphostrongylus tenuis]|uniref:Uncharacterized protein n=1 Tax=Parelaphostrongylus tenuis TaxID=148309 RepID=A0AAD5R0U1_PARTN|nr:hypothetical protein KIN20_028351 [Parelaphostrongylus tenuis]